MFLISVISIAIGLFLTVFALLCISFTIEYKAYNNGVCPYCDEKLEKIRTDDKARHYICRNCGYGTRITLSSVDRETRMNGCVSKT